MYGGVLSKLLTRVADNQADDVVRAIGRTATSKLDDLLPKAVNNTASKVASKATSSKIDDLVAKAGSYLNKSGSSDDVAKTVSKLKDKLGLEFTEGEVPVDKLVRIKEYQPRTTASGAGTTKSVFEKGYQEGMVDQPIVVRKVGDQYQVLGGHSRTLGLEQRAKAGLDNPTSIKARIYDGISDDDAKQISRGANQGGQYETTLDMAKSIAESKRAGLEPMVKRNNIKRGSDFDDYSYAWDAIEKNQKMQEKLNYNLDFSPDTFIATARNARKRGMEPAQFMSVVERLDKGEKLNKKNVDNVVNLLTGKIKALNIKNNQGTLFGDDVGKAIDSVDLLNDFNKVSSDLNSQLNAIKKVKGMDIGDEATKSLDTVAEQLRERLNNIQDEILSRWNSKYSSKEPATTPVDSTTAESTPKSSVAQFGSLTTPIIDEERIANQIVPSEDQMGLFGALEPQTTNKPSASQNTATEAVEKPQGISKKSKKAKTQEPETTEPRNIPVTEINDYRRHELVPVNNLSKKNTSVADSVRKYLPNIQDSDVENIKVRVLKNRDKGKPINVKGSSKSVEIPVENRSRNRQALDMKAAVESLPSKDEVKNMSDDELMKFAQNWRQSTAYALIARAMANNYNQSKERGDNVGK